MAEASRRILWVRNITASIERSRAYSLSPTNSIAINQYEPSSLSQYSLPQ